MATKRCKNGHYYDDSKYPNCPYCGISSMDSSRTIPLVVEKDSDGGVTVPVTNAGGTGMTATEPLFNDDDIKTVGIMKKEKGIDPVVGWLVCIKGVGMGQDYRIMSEKNFIGRDKSNDIVLDKDTSISREKHAVVSYNPKNSKFVLMPGDGHGLVYLNGDEVFNATELKARDVIEMGDTTLMFVPFCGEDFKW